MIRGHQRTSSTALAISLPLASVVMPRMAVSPTAMSPSPNKKNNHNNNNNRDGNTGAAASRENMDNMGGGMNMKGMDRMGMSSMSMMSRKNIHSSAPLTYIPPLCDGACGTTPRSQVPMMEMMMQDMITMVRMMPTICWAMVMQRRHMSWADMGHMMMQIMLACMEMCMMVCAVPMYMMLPGAMFAMWVSACCMMCMAMCWMLNGKEMMHQCVVGSKSWMMGQESDDEKWMFMGGMGMR